MKQRVHKISTLIFTFVIKVFVVSANMVEKSYFSQRFLIEIESFYDNITHPHCSYAVFNLSNCSSTCNIKCLARCSQNELCAYATFLEKHCILCEFKEDSSGYSTNFDGIQNNMKVYSRNPPALKYATSPCSMQPLVFGSGGGYFSDESVAYGKQITGINLCLLDTAPNHLFNFLAYQGMSLLI